MLSIRLKDLMSKNDLGVNQLAVLSKVPAPRISDIRNGKVTNPRINTVVKLSKALGVTLDEFVGR